MPWYRSGTVAVTNGNATVTGTGTAFVANAIAGQGIILPDGRLYEIAAVVSNTQLTLAVGYLGSTAAGQPFVIVPTRGPELKLAQDIAAMVASYGAAFESVGQGLFADGTAAAPGMRYAADQNTGLRRVAADVLALVTGGADRLTINNAGASLAGLLTGTAVTQSATDTTAGRLLKVGDFGLGAGSNPPTLADLDSPLTPPGFYRTINTTVGTFPTHNNGVAVNVFGSLLVAKYLSDNGWQLYSPVANGQGGGKLYFRSYNATTTTWTPWSEIYGRQNILGAVGQSGGVPTGAIIERGNNANGSFTRFADGTMICTHTLAASSGGAATWTFPGAFIAAPVVTGTAVATVASTVCLDANPSSAAATFSARDKTDARRADTCHMIARGNWF